MHYVHYLINISKKYSNRNLTTDTILIEVYQEHIITIMF